MKYTLLLDTKEILNMKFSIVALNGRMAQWLRRPPTEREIPGSNPGVIDSIFFSLIFYTYSVFCLRSTGVPNTN